MKTCYVTIAEFQTGIVLKADGSRYLGLGDYRIEFDDEHQAREFARQYVAAHPDHECAVTSETGVQIAIYRSAVIAAGPDSEASQDNGL